MNNATVSNERRMNDEYYTEQPMHMVELKLNEGPGFYFVANLGHISGSIVGYEYGVMLRGKEPHKPEIADDIVRIHSLMMYTDLIKYNIVGDTKTPLLRFFPFVSELKAGGVIPTGTYMNYQTFSNLQFRPLFNISFHTIHIGLRDTSGEKIPFVSVGIARLALMLKKASRIVSNRKDVTGWLLQDK